jgi:LysM repeat protein
MKNLLKAAQGVIIALISLALLIGILSLSLAEGLLPTPAVSISTSTYPSTSTASPTVAPSPTLQPFTPAATLPPVPVATETQAASPTMPVLPTLTPLATLFQPTEYCPEPVGWVPYIVQPSDSLSSIAAYYQTSAQSIQTGNCMNGTQLIPGTLIYVPPVVAKTAVPCGPPGNWIVYIIQPGDTLYHLGQIYQVSVIDLQSANCMGNSTLLQVGKNFYVPPWAPLVTPVYPPPATLTTMPTFTSTPTSTFSSNTPTDSMVPSPSDTPVMNPSQTPTPTY